MMNKTTDGNFHWITLTGLEPQKEYGFQYFVDGNVRIADPYTEKTLDPWNDKYITEETYPGLKAYPDGKTTEPTSVFQTAQLPYEWQVDDFAMPAVEDMVIYEMHIRDFVATHSYKTVADTLDYLKRLGVNVLELMPINEFEGNNSWGYNPSFYFAPDKYYGPKSELKKLVDEAHKRGIAVVIDLVLNHSYGQSPLVRLYFENGKPAANNPWYNIKSNFTNPDAQWGYDFNHESIHTQELVDSINSFWMSEYNIDGFRFDFTKGFGNNIKDASDSWASLYDTDRIRLLKRMADEIWKRKPSAFISFEHLAENSEEKELANYGINLWGNMNHSYNEGTMGYTESGKSDVSWISYQNRNWDSPNVVGYMESHDEERLMFKNITYGKQVDGYDIRDINTGLHRVELAANFFLTIPGPKMIWQFGELGYDVSIDFNGRVGEKPIKWEYYNDANRKRLYDVYAALAKLKTEQPAFKTDDFALDVRDAIKTIHLNHSDMNVVVLGNFDVVAQPVNPKFQNTGTWYEYYSAQTLEVVDTDAEIMLKPGEYRIYTTKQLEQPDITQAIFDNGNSVSVGTLNVYPNPVADVLYVVDDKQLVQVSILNAIGQKVYVQHSKIGFKQIQLTHLEKGIYIITATDKNGTVYTAKFIKQ
jgi:1,4-alpha-glucan branching enzyme